MANILEIIVQAQDMASDVIEGVGETAAGTASFIEDNWKTISATTAAAGAAAEGFARSQGDTNAIISRMSLVTGESEDALRSSIDGMTNWTFSSKDAARGAEELVRRGVDTKEGFEEVLPVMDNFSDATGRDIVESIKVMDAALASLGIPLEEAGEHVDTFTFLSEKSTVPLEQFERQLGKVGPELQEMGLGLDESASFLLALEEQGLSGREAVREFALAVEQADGDQELLMESLGLTSEELAAQQEALDGAAGMTDDFAAANNNAMTPLERVQQTAGNLMTRFGGLASAAGTAAPALMGVAAVMPALATAKQGLTVATGGLSKAMGFLAANPIVLVIAAIVALVAAIIWLWNNNEAFREFIIGAWNAIKDMFGAVWEAIVGFIEDAWETIQDVIKFAWERVIKPIWDAIKLGIDILIEAIKIYVRIWKEVFKAVGRAVTAVWDNVLKPTWKFITDGIDGLKLAIDTFKEGWKTAWENIKNAVKGPANAIIGFINSVIRGAEALVNSIGSAVNKIPSFTVPSWVPGIGGKTFSLPNIGRISLPRVPSLQAGGIALATPGGFLAQIAEGGRNERIQPIGGPDDPMTQMVRLLEEMLRSLKEARVLSVDGRELANAIGFPLVEEIRSQTGI